MYLDNAATTPLNKDVKEYIISILDDFGNPSSIYNIGKKNKNLIEKSRESVSKFINSNGDIIFTSSGSAANTMAIKGLTKMYDKYILYYSPIAHKSMTLVCKDCKYNHELIVDGNGNIDFNFLKHDALKIDNDEKLIVCIDVANSEIGLIRDINYICNKVHEHNGIVIADFTGYIPSFPVDVQKMNVDIATFSAHKLGALKGVGVLYKKHNINLAPLIYGSQEDGLFAGTENIIGIASLGMATELYDYSKITSYNRDYVYNQLIENVKNCYLVGSLKNRLPHNLYMCFKGISGSDLVTLLDLNNIQVSTGSACNNYSPTPSSTLIKIGMNNDDIFSCIRITFSGYESKEDLDYLVKMIKTNVELLR